MGDGKRPRVVSGGVNTMLNRCEKWTFVIVGSPAGMRKARHPPPVAG